MIPGKQNIDPEADVALSDPNLALGGAHVRTLAQITRRGTWRLELLHAHDHPMLYWITRGQGRVNLQGVRGGLGVHNAVYVPPGCLHAIDLGKQGFGLALRLPDDAQAMPLTLPYHIRVREGQAQADLTALIDAIGREEQGRAPFATQALRAHAALVRVWLHRQALPLPAPDTNAAMRLVMAYADLLVRQYRSGACMADLAAMLDVTPTHLTRCCKEVCGMTAADMLTQISLYSARRLIEDGATPLNRIAEYLGFGSAAYFSRFILHHTGRSPSQLRAQATGHSPAPRP